MKGTQIRLLPIKALVAQGWVTREELELEQIANAIVAWGEAPDAFYAWPGFTAIGCV